MSILNKRWISSGTGGSMTYIVTPSANFNRPNDTTTYASGDLIGQSTTAGSVIKMTFTAARTAGGTGFVRKARLKTSKASVTAASFRATLYSEPPTIASGDNVAFSTTSANILGYIDIVVDKLCSDGAVGQGAPTTGAEISFVATGGAGDNEIYALLEARGAYAPDANETFTLELEIYQN